jgi:SCY1-like protein 1
MYVKHRASYSISTNYAKNRAKVLSAAFARSLRDPFVHARNAALLALSATADLFSEEDCAGKLLPVMCPSLVDKEKLIRDQAQKAVDIYIARIRKYTSTMPDTALPPSAPGAGGTAAPRMGTVGNDSGWAGWAISSFTNKLAAASGQIQTSTNGSSQERPSSVPPPVPNNKPALTPTTRPGMTLAKSTASITTLTSPDPAAAFQDDTEDFSAEWGGFGDDNDDFGTTTTSKSNPANEEEDDPWGTPAITTSSKTYDDKGEPDFAGWLAAQSSTKKPGAKPLPKGLNKSSTSVAASKRPVVGGRTGSAPSATRKVVVPAKKVVKEEAKKEKEDEEEGWGDAW